MTRHWPTAATAALALIAILLLANQVRAIWGASTLPAAVPMPIGADRSDPDALARDLLPTPIVVDSAAMEFRRASDLRGALESARRHFAPESPMLRSLSEEARIACSIVRRPDASARRVEGDPNRRVWLDQLLRRCAGLLDSDLAPPTPTAEALALWNQQLPLIATLRISLDAGTELAHRHVAGSADPQLIAESLRFLLDQQALPLDRIFDGVEPSRADVDAALIYAADWIGCLRADSCGTDGLWTLYTCAQFGCPAGSDLPRALYRILPAQQYETARRLLIWATTP